MVKEISFEVTEQEGRSLGFDTQTIAKRIRENFDGVTLANFLESEEIEVVVRNDPESLSMKNINSFLIKSPQDMDPLGRSSCNFKKTRLFLL